MELTREQIDIIHSTGNIKINAVAGSGKTSTIIEYSRTRPEGSRILYLAFNKSVKIINGKGISRSTKMKAVLARTNLGLLLKAIDIVTEKRNLRHIYFEGNINSYTYADEGASLYDVFNLYNGKHDLIKNALIRQNFKRKAC